jgi:hypothetical protein
MRSVSVVLVVCLLAWASGTFAAVPGEKSLVALEVGSGTTSTNAAPIFMNEYSSTTAGAAAIQSVSIQFSGSQLTIKGNASSEGMITFNEGYLGIGGYVAAAGAVDPTTSTSAVAPRAVVGYDISQDLANGPALGSSVTNFSGKNLRAAMVVNGNFYAVGQSEGPVYIPNGLTNGTGTDIATGPASLNYIAEVGGDLYSSLSSGSRGMYKVAGTPTTTGNTNTISIATPQSQNGNVGIQPNQFWISPDLSVAYIADDAAGTTARPGGVKKYVKNPTSGVWELQYNMNCSPDGIATSSVRALAVDYTGSAAQIFVVTLDGTKILSFTDTGVSDPTLTTLQTAPEGAAFKGIVLLPEPSSLALLGLASLAVLRRPRKR